MVGPGRRRNANDRATRCFPLGRWKPPFPAMGYRLSPALARSIRTSVKARSIIQPPCAVSEGTSNVPSTAVANDSAYRSRSRRTTIPDAFVVVTVVASTGTSIPPRRTTSAFAVS